MIEPATPAALVSTGIASAITHAAGLARRLVVTLLGFASGVPLALVGQALQPGMATEGLNIAAIGFLSLVGLRYTVKFLWAPLMDRLDVFGTPGRRRGWFVLTPPLLAGALTGLSTLNPAGALQTFALLALWRWRFCRPRRMW